MNNGIVLVALGYPLYGEYAYNMAMSLKSYDKDIRVCILYEQSAISTLKEEQKKFFDQMIMVPEIHYMVNGQPQYQRVKLCVDLLSPFDFTMYMDADNIWFPAKKPSHFMGEVINKEFTIGLNGEYSVQARRKSNPKYTWWGDPAVICKYFGIKEYLMQTVSGFYSFHKTEKVKALFEKAREIYDDPNAPTKKWANGKADEYCFNAAMGILGMRQEPFSVFYFDKLDGRKDRPFIYNNFWGLAIGGVKVSENVVLLYNELVNKLSQKNGILARYYHKDKAQYIPERKTI